MNSIIKLLFFSCICLSVHGQNVLLLKPDSVDGKDAEVGLMWPNNNFGNNDKIGSNSWTIGGTNNIVRNFLAFDLSSLPNGAVITDAKLSLYHKYDHLTAPTQHSGANDLRIQRVTLPWLEHTVTWNNQPTTTSMNDVLLPPSSSPTQDYTNINVTNMVQDMIADPNNSFGFRITVDNETPYRIVMLASSDHWDESIHPSLEITYTSSVGINDLPHSSSINIYLQSQQLVIDFGNYQLTEDIRLKINNALGQLILMRSIQQKKLVIDLPQSLYPGNLYFIQLFSSKDLLLTKKIIW